ncbi:suppressor of ascus dominance [Metarhizium acridum CQMa 102]|uniref:RNA-dependent RNA polymerase n=1 Tax=Metarhizium acridum (strain CQMa 102) TaxID=655827 RepID=E9DTN4_METAQ|nr:suppressor of ascus dominance [Metarhizium acridum CQMa 102]EFY93089.1 suppressor of ascus dominance [Metarhizium acridum CQMa 102]
MPPQQIKPEARQQNPLSHGRGSGSRIEGLRTASIPSSNSQNEWRTRPFLTIRVNNLPVDISAEYIWRWFASEGNILWIDLFDPKSGNGTMSAKIRFEPPPRLNIWDRGPVRVEHPDTRRYPTGLKLMVSLDERPPVSTLKSTRYPDRITLKLNSLAFGTGIPLELNVRSNIMSISFSTVSHVDNRGSSSSKECQVRLKISNIKTILESTADNENELRHWVISLPYPQEYFEKVDNIMDTFQGNPQTWNLSDTWQRATDISPVSNDAHPISIHNEAQFDDYIDIGRWTTFRLSFDPKGCVFDTKTEAPSLWDYLEHPLAVPASQPSALLSMPQKIHLPFEVRYQLEVCISRGVLNEYTIGIDFLQELNNLRTMDATHRLEYLVDQNEILFDPMKLFSMEDATAFVPAARIPHYCTYVRKASITPTTIRFNSPTVETSNRVVRKYSHVQDRFLRVQFVEESELVRLGKTKYNNVKVWKRVERALSQGIRIGDRQYEFLAFGSSQLRQSSAYFFCPTDHLSCEDIRAWMGQFDHIKCVAKYAARLGQCFSTTRDIKGIWVPDIKYIDDIQRNGQCFTDGVGLISKFLSQLIMEEMTLDIFDKPTAFQFRMGGCKGVLAVWPQAQGMEVHIRKSQEKFKSNFQALEIVRCAARSTATLNRQTITILESLGVRKKIFMELLKEQISWYENATKDTSEAIKLLTKFVDENQSSLVLAELLKAGFKTDNIQESFTLNIFNLWLSWSFRLLKEKTRIHVPKSAFVLGCVDESGSLRGHSTETEGSSDQLNEKQLPQIFLQLTDPSHEGKTNTIQGKCIVGRNPSLHPGDIRVVQAVNNPKLRHLKDVIVFPSKGDRPVPAMLSGGDLDGDDFFIIWDDRLIPEEWNHKPMDYEAPSPRQLDRDVTVDDLREFFVNYMKNDNLGLIAVAHLAFADMYGPKSQICLRLAELHSQAVDYAKTGEPAEFGYKMQPERWPHFMEKKSTYRSKKALGALYDEVAKHTFQFRPEWGHSFDERILERYEFDKSTLTAAREIKAQYDSAIRRLMVQYHVETEYELYTGWVMSNTSISSNYKRQEDLGLEFDVVKQRFREQCCNVAGGSEAPQLDKFVAAMYKVTEEQVNKARNRGDDEPVSHQNEADPSEELKPNVPLISFPWIFHWVMIRLAMGDKYKPGESVLAAARRACLFNRHSHLKSQPKPVDIAAAETLSGVDTNEDMEHGVISDVQKIEETAGRQTTNMKENNPVQSSDAITTGDKILQQDEDDSNEDISYYAVSDNDWPRGYALDSGGKWVSRKTNLLRRRYWEE